jgi:hypothetical protein
VRDLGRVESFLASALDITRREGGDDYARLDNGSICLWLVEDRSEPPPAALVLSLATSNVAEAVEELLTRGATLLEPPRFVCGEREEAVLCVDDWLTLVVGRTYDEDELGITPELGTELPWEDDARALLKHLLRKVPVAFRGGARDKAVARSEVLAVARGDVVVGRVDAISAIVDVTPAFQHPALRDALAELGEDPTLVRDVTRTEAVS